MKERGNPALRRFDRMFGIPLVAALRLFRRRKRTRPEMALAQTLSTVDRPDTLVITFLKSAAIGDTVLLSAVVRDLRAALPECRLQFACGTSNASLAAMLEGVDRIVALPMSSPLALWRLRRQLRSDVFIDFDSWPRINALLTFISGSKTTIGFRTAGQHRHGLYDLTVDHASNVHEVENYRRLLRPLVEAAGKTLDGAPLPWLRLPQPATEPTSEQRKTIVFHMHAGGSQARFKEWPEDHWVALANELTTRGFRIRLSGSAADLQRNEAMARRVRPGADVTTLPLMSLASLGSLLGDVRAVVTVDTGIAHLAGAAGAGTVALHGATSPQRWGALGPRVHHLKDAQPPWIQLGFEVLSDGSPVLLSADEVRDAVLAMAGAEPTLD